MSLALMLPGNILPIQMKSLGLSDTAKWFILSFIGQVFNMTVCPYISVASDLCRSKLGRRIYFIIMSMPPIVLSLILFAFTQKFGAQLATWVQPYWSTSPATMTAVVMGIAMLLFQFFMMWINSVIWYIFIDIVPAEFFSRIMACMRLGFSLVAYLFHYFLFPLAEGHATSIFIGVAILYAIGISLMCRFVKEGTYPPLTPEQLARKNAKGWDIIMTKIHGLKEFVTVTFCDRVYVYRYLFGVCAAIGGAAGTFGYFLSSQQLGLTDEHIGKMNGLCSLVGLVGIFLAACLGKLVNRWHPARIIAYHYVFSIMLGIPFLFRWLLGTMPPQVYVAFIVANSAIYLVLSGLIAVSEQPTEMLLFPKSRYGTFCAMQAMMRSVSALICGFIAARVFDFVANHFATCHFAQVYGENWHYRFISPWSVPWQFLVAFMAYKVYRGWAERGGYVNYAAIAPWSEGGKDQVERMPCVPVRPEKFKKYLYLFDACFVLFTVMTPLFAFWNCRWRANPETGLLNEYLVVPTVIVLVTDILWLILRLRLVKRANENPDGTGLFHPTLLFMFLGLSVADKVNEFVAIARTGGSYGSRMAVVNAISVLVSLLAIAVISHMERGVRVPEPEPVVDAPEKSA